VNDFKKIVELARRFQADSVVGIGGGSVLDVTKLVAAFLNSDQQVEDCFGTGFIRKKGLWFACLPTTAGTGSEVSPNAILLDERDHLKKGIVSPFLIADAAYVDPKLTWTVPAKVTADTGMDALTHCIEAYTNKFAHPAVDIYAMKGILLIAANLERAVKDGKDVEAREALALGSLYGGLCLGPVNTAAVHALSYPLGGEFHIPHGLSNAILLPSVMKFNAEVCPQRYAEVAVAFGLSEGCTPEETAQRGVDFIYRLAQAVGIPDKLTALGIPQSAVDGMAKAAMQVQRLLKNNPREVTEQDARDIYNSLY
jgi:alcohol dehydrogenase class IV